MKAKGRTFRKIGIVAGVILVGAWIVSNQLNGADAPAVVADTAAKPQSVALDQRETLVAKVEPFSLAFAVSGTLTPVKQAVVRSKISAEVIAVTVREGDRVEAGATIVELDTTDLRNQLNEKRNNLAAGEAELALAETELKNKKAVFEKNYISRFDYDTAVSSMNVRKANVAALRSQVELAKTALANAEMRAPFAGIISHRRVNPGEKVAIDGELLTLVNLDILELKVGVPVSNIARVQSGQAVRFQVDGFAERTFAGTVARINPTTDAGSGTVSVYVTVDNSDATLRGGMFASGDLLLEPEKQVVVLPDSAIGLSDSEPFALVIVDGVLALRKLELGARDPANARTVILSGIGAGDVVVTSGVDRLEAGLTVRLSLL